MMHQTAETTARNLLVGLGIGQFNATQVIPWLFTQPATSDPKQPAVILLVKKIQHELNKCGANLRETGYLDLPTSSALVTVVGERWETLPWADTVKAVLSAVHNKVDLAERDVAELAGLGGDRPLTPPPKASFLAMRRAARPRPPTPVLSELGFLGLPDVPGGVVTYGVAAFLLYRYLKKRKG